MFSKIKTKHLIQVLFALSVIFLLLLFKDFSGRVNSSSESISTIAQTIKSFCVTNVEKYGGKENCYANEFNELTQKNGQLFSFQVLDTLQQMDSDAIGCHLIAHGIGSGAYKRDPGNWRNLITTMTTTCSYGGIHGVIENYVASLPDKSLSRKVIPTICGENPRADCNHIVGHLVLVETEGNVDKALELCKVFTDKQQNSFCISGVFMEYQTALNLIAHNLVPKSWLNWADRLPELEKMCRSYTGENAEGCWEEIVHVALVKFNYDPKKIFDFCSTAQVPNGDKRCKRHSLGIIGATKNFNLSELKYICEIPQKDDPGFQSECYPAMVASSLSTIPSGTKQAVVFCNSLDAQFQQGCFAMIGSMSFAGQIPKAQLEKDCESAPASMRNYCTGGSPNPGQNFYPRRNDR